MRIIPTGSQVYGPATKESDYDFVVDVVTAKRIEQFLIRKNVNITYSKEINPQYEGLTFLFCGEKFQLIVVLMPEELDEWEYATKQMKNLAPIKDRAERVAKFTWFRMDYRNTYLHETALDIKNLFIKEGGV